ncbi:TPA: ATP-binding cassette domain-containing protein [Escherichia coli]|uniref:ATP-binding cassette domain-containing protein n=1 Tax=Escherichia coli TaxID=562 RepID=UPI001B938768|nr:ATP-binding cassette domain-containing protein [Escherichia coli]MDO2727867.1 ATP-binding cassette domain-containing protein [Escherichia coli]MDO2791022.1 ATP-binding cassette domain-containing protein [Escherichia coli]HBC9905527.1 ATP-binding cassette domain-containing protein [Escherichia coli]HBE3855117.1 ATP-binding cassette domain-containing protein [Escherichia coli]
MIKLSIEEKMFPDRVIISDFNISIQKNEFVVITGVSGAGKSTLLNIIGLIDTSYHGRYILDGVDVSGIDYKRQLYLRGSYFGYIFQDSLINEKQTIRRNLLSVIELKKQKEYNCVILNELEKTGLHGISPETSAALLSGGEKQRVALARALLRKPKILLADEPTASLDNDNKIKIMDILLDYHNHGGTVIMVTHDTNLITNDMRIISF